MTAPQLPAGWGAPSAPAAPPAQQPYPQQFAPQPQAPPQYAPQAYAPPAPYPPVQPQYPGYPDPNFQQYQQMPAPMAQQYGYPQQPQAPAGPAPRTGTLADYASQPEAGANFWKFKNPGDTNMGVVARDLTDTDTKERTFRGQVQKRFDGSPDWVLSIPMKNADGTDGIFEVGGKDRTALKNALIAAGKADGIPAKGWAIRATFTHFQQNNGGGQPSRIKQIEVAPPGLPDPSNPATMSHDATMAAQPQHVQAALQQPQYATATFDPASGGYNGQSAPQQPVPAQPAPQAAGAQQPPQAQPAPGPAYQPQAAPQPQQFQQPGGGQFAGMPADAAAQFASMLGGSQPPQQPQG